MTFFFLEAAARSYKPTPANGRLSLSRAAKSMGLQELWKTSDPSQVSDANTTDIVKYIAGYLTMKYNKQAKCKECETVLLSNAVSCSFIEHKDFTAGALTRPNEDVVNALRKAEDFVVSGGNCLLRSGRIVKNLLNRTQALTFPETPCHPTLRDFFLRNFFKLRIHHGCKLLTAKLKSHGLCRKKKDKKLNMVARGIVKKAAQRCRKVKKH